jgi:hypothetical protein
VPLNELPPLAGGESRAEERAFADHLFFLLAAQRSLRARFEEFRRAYDRRDGEAFRVALADFSECLKRWTGAEEEALLPAVVRSGVPGRDVIRELRLEWVQVRELTRYLLAQVMERAPVADVLGLIENLDRRLCAHESEMEKVYYPAAARSLTPDERRVLDLAKPPE